MPARTMKKSLWLCGEKVPSPSEGTKYNQRPNLLRFGREDADNARAALLEVINYKSRASVFSVSEKENGTLVSRGDGRREGRPGQLAHYGVRGDIHTHMKSANDSYLWVTPVSLIRQCLLSP